jgi:hypothetical protein
MRVYKYQPLLSVVGVTTPPTIFEYFMPGVIAWYRSRPVLRLYYVST